MTEVPQQQDPYELPEYKCYREELALAKSTRLEIFKIFASHSLAISGGLVAAIGYLIKEFNDLSYLWLLLFSAGFATATLVAALFELVFSQISTTHVEAKLHKVYRSENSDEEKRQITYYSNWCTKLLYAIPWLILIAVFTTGLFLGLNIPHFRKGEGTMTNEKKLQEIFKFIVTDTSDKPKLPFEKQEASIVTDGPVDPKGRPSAQQETKSEGEKPPK